MIEKIANSNGTERNSRYVHSQTENDRKSIIGRCLVTRCLVTFCFVLPLWILNQLLVATLSYLSAHSISSLLFHHILFPLWILNQLLVCYFILPLNLQFHLCFFIFAFLLRLLRSRQRFRYTVPK